MLGGIKSESIYIVCGYTDLRRSIDGLAHIVTSNYELDPFSKSMFLFCGRRRDRIKALLYEGDGFLLLYKRLDNGSFQWPRSKSEALKLSSEQFTWLMQGLAIEQPKAIKKISNTTIHTEKVIKTLDFKRISLAKSGALCYNKNIENKRKRGALYVQSTAKKNADGRKSGFWLCQKL